MSKPPNPTRVYHPKPPKPSTEIIQVMNTLFTRHKSTLHLRNWDTKPMRARPEDLERGKIRRRTENILEARELDAELGEIWE